MNRFLLPLFLVLAAPASVLDHGLSWIEPFASDPTVKWFETLRNKMGGSCCGLGDAYEIQIDVEAPHDDSTDPVGVAHITDGSGPRLRSKHVTVASTSDRYVLLRRYEMNCAAALAATQPKAPSMSRRVRSE
jgi:hypothetical protein